MTDYNTGTEMRREMGSTTPGYDTNPITGTGLADLTDVREALPADERTGAGYGTGDTLQSGTDTMDAGSGYASRPGYADDTATGGEYNNTVGERPTAGQRIKEALPGTTEHKEKKAMEGAVGPGAGYESWNSTDAGAKPSMGERIKQAVPGTAEYRETHGDNRMQQRAENAKSDMPWTQEHKEKETYRATGGGITGPGTEYTATGMNTAGGNDDTAVGYNDAPGAGFNNAGAGFNNAGAGFDNAGVDVDNTVASDDNTIGTRMSRPGEHLAGGFGTGQLAAQYQEPTYPGVPLTPVEGGMEGTDMAVTGAGNPTATMTTGDKIESRVPGTDEYAETHGVDRREMQAENLKAKVPGTSEHRERKMMMEGATADPAMGTGGAAYDTGAGRDLGTDSGYGSGMGTGMNEDEAVRGVDSREQQASLLNTQVPGTDANQEERLVETGAEGSDPNVGAVNDPYAASTDYDATRDDTVAGTDSGYGADTTTGYDQNERKKEGLGHKIAKHVPGTAARKEYKAEKAAGGTTY